MSIDLDRKSIRMNTCFYRKCPIRPTRVQSILIKLTFRQNFYGFLSNFPGTILWQKSNQILLSICYPKFVSFFLKWKSNPILSKIASHISIHFNALFLKMEIESNLIKNSIPHFYLLLYSFLYRNLIKS